MRGLLVLGVVALLTAPALADPRLTESQVRGLAERQSHAWNAGDLAAYFATFAPTARFTDQALGNDNRIVPYGVSTLAEAREQSRKTLARGKVHETLSLGAVMLAADGRTAQLAADVVTQISGVGAPRRVCAKRTETFALTPPGPRATGQTDTIVRCRAGAIG
ncbi:hypothetical protein [Phenylobacterium sp.]|jgi:hypothetical protein|uniref:hypothetical protein n=1 Tax=Phenylobacterium sp. TaxID=1871053 RepID=UPI002E3434CC|nr:hypothetical protein [Phenylobacterium sp.]HEX3367066.1 hypothetical protein [Phenylobacterium sp.]